MQLSDKSDNGLFGGRRSTANGQEGRETHLDNMTKPSFKRAVDAPNLLQPINRLRRDHQRLRSFCKKMGYLVDDFHQRGNQQLAFSLHQFLTAELPRCWKHGEELLAPALMRQPMNESDPNALLAELRRHHQSEKAVADIVVGGLNRLVAGSMIPHPLEFIVSGLQLAEILESNIGWENTVLVPLAASRLNKEDQEALGF